MKRILVPAISVLCFAACLEAASSSGCIGSVSMGTFNVSVQPPNGTPLPLSRLNILPSGCKILYRPGQLPSEYKDKAKVALVAIPSAAESSTVHQVTLLEPHAAANAAEWPIPFRVSLLVLVLGPQGLDEKRVTALISKEEDIAGPLADYAAQTADLEEMIDALNASVTEDAPPPEAGNAKLVSYSDQNRSVPTEQILMSILRALNPSVFASSPLGAGRKTMPATLAGKATSGFFENAGDFVPGGGILPSVKTWLFPDTEFRAVFAQPDGEAGLCLCAQRQVVKTRNRIAYLWAHRFVDSDPPALALPRQVYLPIGLKSSFSVKLGKSSDWQLIPHVQEWTMESRSSAASIPVVVKQAQYGNALEIDLRKFPPQPGSYRLVGRWDWKELALAGELQLQPIADMKGVVLTASSRDALMEGRGTIPVRLTGTNFEFIERIFLKKKSNAERIRELFPTPPIDSQAGPRQNLDLDLDTTALRADAYTLEIVQAGGKSQEVPITVLPPGPKLENLPVRLNLGEQEQKIMFRGSGMERIEAILSDRATFKLEASGSNQTKDIERHARASLLAGAKPGDLFPISLKISGIQDPLQVPDAILVAGPRPRIIRVKASLPEDLSVTLHEGELPAGSVAGFSLSVENLEEQAAIQLQCAEQAKTIQVETIQLGEEKKSARLEGTRGGALFLSMDAGTVGRGNCSLTAVLETASAGRSEPFPLGRVVKFPRIESFSLTEEKISDGVYMGILKGLDLELIEKTGWDGSKGLPVPDLPTTTAGQGQIQTLKVAIPWPSPSPRAPLYVFFRGESEGRPVRIK